MVKSCRTILMIPCLIMLVTACSKSDGGNKESLPPEIDDEGRRRVDRMAILGDSLATGVLNDTTIGQEVGFTFSGKVILNKQTAFDANLNDLQAGRDLPRTINNVQEIYKERPSAYYGGIDMPDDAWSHAYRLGLTSGQVINFATVAHHTTHVIEEQLPVLEANADDADYVVLQVGANDFCSSNITTDGFIDGFRDRMAQIIARLAALEEHPVVLVMPIVDVPRVMDITAGRDALWTDLISTTMEVSCDLFQLYYCPGENLLPDAQWRELRRQMNNITLDLVTSADDPAGTRFVWAGEISSWEAFSAEDLAIDCFHPAAGILETMSGIGFDAVRSHLQVP